MSAISYTPTIIEGNAAAWLQGDNAEHIVGESYYQAHLLPVAAHLVSTGAPIIAWLVPEPDNPHDENAVAVYIGGGKVGYLSREMAPRWQWVMVEIFNEGRRPACAAKFFVSRSDRPWINADEQVEVLLFLPHPPRRQEQPVPPSQAAPLSTTGLLTVHQVMLAAKCVTCGMTTRVPMDQLDNMPMLSCGHAFSYNPVDLLGVVESIRKLATSVKAKVTKG